MLGHGTFGQVVKAKVLAPDSYNRPVAVKILKNKQAFFKQGMLEVGVLSMVRLKTWFISLF